MSHPPGKLTRALPHFETIAPRKTMEDLIFLISPSGITHLNAFEASVSTLSEYRSARAPSASRISTAVSASLICGQFEITHGSSARSEAAKMGRTLFFAP